MSAEPIFIPDLGERVPSIPEGSILSQTLMNDSRTKAVLFAFAPGQELSAHTSSWPAFVHVVSGEGELTLGEDSFTIRSGSWSYMPAGLVHSIKAEANLTLLLHMVKV